MEEIKKLREQTGAGIVDCKNALTEAEGDFDQAVEILRKKGISKATKREDREATEGVIKLQTSEDNKKGYILEINSETDFVAKNETFQAFGDKVLKLIVDQEPQSLEELLNLNLEKASVKEELDNLVGVIGEKLEIGRFDILKGETVAAYSHMGGKIGVLIALDKENKTELATDLAMQVAATNPQYTNPNEVPEEEVNKEKEFHKEQLKEEGKPEEIIEKIIEGKINKYFEQICLTKQEFIKEDKKKVEEILGDATIKGFVRYSL